MAGELMPLTPQHVDEAARLLGQAFGSDPGWLVLFEGLDDNERLRRMTAVFAASLAACLGTGRPLEVRDGNRTIAAATIYPPGAYPLPLPAQVTIFARCIWHAGLFRPKTWAITKRSLDMMGEMSQEHPRQNHYYWEYIGVLPDYQGQGIGSHICRTLVQRADQDQVGSYLETTNPRNVPLYERLGFQTVREREIMGSRWWFMWRAPQRPSFTSVSVSG